MKYDRRQCPHLFCRLLCTHLPTCWCQSRSTSSSYFSPTHKPPPPPPSVFHPTRRYPHCSRALLSVACSPRPRRCGGGGHRAAVHSRYQQRCLWRIILFIAFVRRARQVFVSLLPTYCCSLSRYWCSSVVRFCLCYLANWVMDEGWKHSSKNRTVEQCPDHFLLFWFLRPLSYSFLQ